MVVITMTRDRFKQFMQDFKEGIANDFINALVRRVPVDTSNLKIQMTARPKGKDIEIAMPEYAKYVEFGTAPHVIEPKDKKVLAFKINGKKVVTKRVYHPGTRPQPFIRPAFHADLPLIIANNLRRHAS